jgi:2'-5' RNA ligase
MQENRKTMRTFIAIEIPGDILDKISDILHVLKKGCPDVRWVRAESIHLTLKFLGNIDAKRLDSLTLESARGVPEFVDGKTGGLSKPEASPGCVAGAGR